MLVCMEIGTESVGRGLEFSRVVLGFRGGSHDNLPTVWETWV